MAASISQTRYDYKIKLQEAIRDGKIVTVGFEKCPLCRENNGCLLCDVCVNEGQFCHTANEDGERFQDKKQELLIKQCRRKDIADKLESEVYSTEIANGKRSAIEAAKKKIKLLKKALTDTKAKHDLEKRLLSHKKRIRRNVRLELDHRQQIILPELKRRIANLSYSDLQVLPVPRDLEKIQFNKDLDIQQLPFIVAKWVSGQQGSQSVSKKCPQEGTSIDPKSVPVLLQELGLYNQYLAIQRRAFIQRLTQRIFPLKEVLALNEESHLEMSMAAALKDASETAFIAGRWVHVDLRGENHCQIVNTILPEYSGDSSALGLFVMINRYLSDTQEETIPAGNASFGIQGALSYSVMLVNMIAQVCDVHMPRKCSYRELRDDIREQDFCNFVWRLNENMLHLCASQGVGRLSLVDYLSLRNLLHCIHSPSLGRVGGFDVTYDLPYRAELCPLEYESDDEDDDSPGMDVAREWERVPSGLPTYDTSNMGVSAPVDTSTTGALINAAASLTGWIKSYYNK